MLWNKCTVLQRWKYREVTMNTGATGLAGQKYSSAFAMVWLKADEWNKSKRCLVGRPHRCCWFVNVTTDNTNLRIRWKQAGKTWFSFWCYFMMHIHIHLVQTHTTSVEFTYSSKWNIVRLAIFIILINYWSQLQPKRALLKKEVRIFKLWKAHAYF